MKGQDREINTVLNLLNKNEERCTRRQRLRSLKFSRLELSARSPPSCVADGGSVYQTLKAKCHYAIAGSKLVADRFEAGSKLVADLQRAAIWPII